jgi:phosphoenolpyruvate-protein kinase (PTS system EI component)
VTARVFRGVPVSGGVAAGTARVIGIGPSSKGRSEVGLMTTMGVPEALDAVAAELEEVADRLRDSGHPDEAEIVSVGALIARDPVLREDADRESGSGKGTVEGILAATERHAAAMEGLGDPALRERAIDIRQVGRRAVAVLRGGQSNGRDDGPQVLVAEELGPAEVIGIEGGQVVAGVAVRGGPNSHAAIVARSVGLPLVLGVEPSVLAVADGLAVLVDGDEGTVMVAPPEDVLAGARRTMAKAARRRTALAQERGLACETTDGRAIGLLCNVATVAETRAGLEAGAEGVGLLRTELAFLDAAEWPGEDDHRKALEPILGLLDGKRAVVRVLDFGGDKVPPFLARELPQGPGPHIRGLPALLSTKDALGAQLRAALDLGRRCKLGILVPMVTSLREVRRAREILGESADAVGAPVPELGVMVEVPSAGLLADRLAEELDFLSIGTNDLTEHVLGVGRRDPETKPALAAHPSVLALINRVARAGRERGCAVRVCGEAAADPMVLPLLVGMGVESLSVSPGRIDEVRARVRRLSFAACAEASRAALASDSIEEVWELVGTCCSPELP